MWLFQGIITYLGPKEGIVNSEQQGELPFDLCENFSDTEFNSSDIHKEVEFTTITVSLTEQNRASHPSTWNQILTKCINTE